jgi:hypothetical protein
VFGSIIIPAKATCDGIQLVIEMDSGVRRQVSIIATPNAGFLAFNVPDLPAQAVAFSRRQPAVAIHRLHTIAQETDALANVRGRAIPNFTSIRRWRRRRLNVPGGDRLGCPIDIALRARVSLSHIIANERACDRAADATQNRAFGFVVSARSYVSDQSASRAPE